MLSRPRLEIDSSIPVGNSVKIEHVCRLMKTTRFPVFDSTFGQARLKKQKTRTNIFVVVAYSVENVAHS